MTMIDGILQELEQEAMATRRALERVPADRLEWRPHPKSRTLGELAAHIAALPGAIAQMATAERFEVSQIAPPRSMTAAELPAVLNDSVATARATLSNLPDEWLGGMWQMVDRGTTLVSMPRAALLRTVMLNHWYHHRGQLTVYLRELDVAVPSIYGPSADESPFAR